MNKKIITIILAVLILILSGVYFFYLFNKNFQISPKADKNMPSTATKDQDVSSKYKLHIESPNGGEKLRFGTTTKITWTAENIEYVDIYQFDEEWFCGEMRKNLLGEKIQASLGGWDWEIYENANCQNSPLLYKILLVGYDKDGMEVAIDTTDLTFDILPGVEITSPQAGETWKDGESHPITWNAEPSIKTVKIFLSSGQAVEEVPSIITDEGTLQASIGKYIWKTDYTKTVQMTPGQIPDVSLWIMGYDSSGRLVHTAKEYFKVVPALSILSPDGNKKFAIGDNMKITWKSGGFRKIRFFLLDADSTNNTPTSWSGNDLIPEYGSIDASGGTYQWTINPKALTPVPSGKKSNKYIIKAVGYDYSDSQIVFDDSEPFTINF